MKKTYILALAASTVGLLGVAGVVTAASLTKPNSLASEIATKFHLNQNDVQSVINSHQQEVQTDREQNYQARLDETVTDGKITVAQKAQILAKHQEIVNFMATLKDKTPADQRAAMQTEMASVRQWATDNKIPMNLLGFFGGRGMGRGMRNPAAGSNSAPMMQ